MKEPLVTFTLFTICGLKIDRHGIIDILTLKYRYRIDLKPDIDPPLAPVIGVSALLRLLTTTLVMLL